MWFELALGAIFLLSAFTMGFAGFGFALVAVPLLTLLIPVQHAVALQLPFSLILFSYSGWHYRHHFSWSHVQPLIAGTIAGLTLGTLLLLHLPETALKRILAACIIAVVLLNLLPLSKAAITVMARSRWWGIFWGFISGSFMGAYTIGGPPATVYIMSVSSNSYQAKSFLGSYFAVLFVLMACIYSYTGVLTQEFLQSWLMFLPVVVLGFIVGIWAFARVSNLLYRRAVTGMLLFAALLLWLE